MAIIVQKFGGTSVADTDRIKLVAERVKREVDEGNHVAVVVSAMSGHTNQLVGFVDAIAELTSASAQAEYDTVVSAGEQITSGLLALALQAMGIPARSWNGPSQPFRTDTSYSRARIERIDTEPLHKAFEQGEVVVIPGFQGISPDGRLATLGRGGSDTSAVALAAALKADRCDIFTDVDGIYTTDPRIAPKARKLKKIGYEEMLEMASSGAKVLQTRSVEMAMNYNVPLQVLSSFEDLPGSMLVNEEEVMERRVITGVTYSKNDAQILIVGAENMPGVAAHIFGPLADNQINVDMIVQNISKDGKATDLTFTLPKTDVEQAEQLLEAQKTELKYDSLIVKKDVAKVSVVGVGMKSHAGVAQQMFSTLAEKGINIHVISTSEIKISVLIDAEYLELAIRALHTAYGLDDD